MYDHGEDGDEDHGKDVQGVDDEDGDMNVTMRMTMHKMNLMSVTMISKIMMSRCIDQG